MAGVDLQLLTKTIYERLTADALGTSVRAAVGNGASSIIRAQELNKDTLPVRPLLALRRGPMPGQSYDMRLPTWRWWVYDDRTQGYGRINSLTLLIEQAYPRYSVANGAIVVAQIGDEFPDDTLGLFGSWVQLVFYTRG